MGLKKFILRKGLLLQLLRRRRHFALKELNTEEFENWLKSITGDYFPYNRLIRMQRMAEVLLT